MQDVNQVSGIVQAKANPDTTDEYGPEPAEPTVGGDRDDYEEGKVRGHWDKRLTSFQKLIFIKAFSEEKVSKKEKRFLCFLIWRSYSSRLYLSRVIDGSCAVFQRQGLSWVVLWLDTRWMK